MCRRRSPARDRQDVEPAAHRRQRSRTEQVMQGVHAQNAVEAAGHERQRLPSRRHERRIVAKHQPAVGAEARPAAAHHLNREIHRDRPDSEATEKLGCPACAGGEVQYRDRQDVEPAAHKRQRSRTGSSSSRSRSSSEVENSGWLSDPAFRRREPRTHRRRGRCSARPDSRRWPGPRRSSSQEDSSRGRTDKPADCSTAGPIASGPRGEGRRERRK